jgi:hypothetical protein
MDCEELFMQLLAAASRFLVVASMLYNGCVNGGDIRTALYNYEHCDHAVERS